MKKILFVNLQGRIAGAETSLLLLLKYLRKDFEIAAACPAESPLSRRTSALNVSIFAIREIRSSSRLRFIKHLLLTSLEIIRITLIFKPQIIHANGFYETIACIPAHIITRRLLIWHARDIKRFCFSSRVMSYCCKRIIAVSETVKNHLLSHGIRPDKISVVNNGVDLCHSIPSETAMRGDRPAVIRFANIGQFVPWKRQEIFIKAACTLCQKNIDAEFYLIGDDVFERDKDYKSDLLAQIRNTAGCRIRHIRWQEDMSKIWDNLDCLVHTAATEPFGRVIVEAMARGIAVIAVDACGPKEIIQNEITGLLVSPDNFDELIFAMHKIATDRKYAADIASAGRDRARMIYSAVKTARETEEIYREVTAA